jgi:hypothetical protein
MTIVGSFPPVVRRSLAWACVAAVVWTIGCVAPARKGRGVRSRSTSGAGRKAAVVDPNLKSAPLRSATSGKSVGASSEEIPTPPTGPTPPPVLVSALPSAGDFGLLANGGWNANWYVGHNTCWVVKLPPVPSGKVDRVFLGAKLGAMKTEPVPGRPAWERRPIPGEIDIAVAPQPLWPQNRRFFLTATSEIPLAGDGDNALEGVGEARWFWVEVPAKALSSTGPNYVALFSPSESLRDESRAPILAAGPATVEDNAWLNTAVGGGPPLTVGDALKTPVSSYEPAVAVKWIPSRSPGPQVSWVGAPIRSLKLTGPQVLTATVSGPDVSAAWLEMSTDGLVWKRTGAILRGAPYAFTLWPDRCPEGSVQVRAVARDQWESRGVSPVVTLRVVRP